jgi:methylenetetrahydrofolate reductase (NADPH)
MKVIDIINGDKPALSFEVFPPRSSGSFETIRSATENVARLAPTYMSVTYGAGGGTSEYTVSIADNLQKNFGVTAVAHLTCISSTHEGVAKQLQAMKQAGIENVLALRGDIPAGGVHDAEYKYAIDLIPEIKAAGDFCIGGACYPEGHPESATQMDDIRHLKEKVDAGCQYLVTQMFFDNNVFYNFLFKCREAGITVPIIPGIMPVTNGKQLKNIARLSGQSVPARFRYIVDRFGANPAAMRQAGIAYTTEQIIDLYANGINAVHIYSMNKADVAAQIQANISEILK